MKTTVIFLRHAHTEKDPNQKITYLNVGKIPIFARTE